MGAFGLGPLAWKLWLGNFGLETLNQKLRLGTSPANISLGTWFGELRLRICLWDLSLGELGLWRLGDPVDGSRGNRGGRFRLPVPKNLDKNPAR